MIYKEVRFDGVREFTIGELELRITGKHFLAAKFDLTVPYAQLRKTCNTVWTRPRSFQHGLSLLCLGFILTLAAGLYDANNINLVAFPAVVFGLPGLAYMACTWKRVEFKQFLYKGGIVAFDMARTGPMRGEFDQAVSAILEKVPPE